MFRFGGLGQCTVHRCPASAFQSLRACSASATCSLPIYQQRRCAANTSHGRAPPHPTPTPPSSRQAQLQRVCDAIYRSSTAREALRQAIHEPSREIALHLLSEFEADAGVWRDQAWATEFLAVPPSSLSAAIRLVVVRFTQWHTVRKAPLKVSMEAPWEWYPLARLTRRRFIFHYGPTNSGKTHAALEAMIAARSGVYCAPLKALAAQVWHRVNERVPCDLLIGDERVFGGAAEHVACTVEMAPVDFAVDVAVIDEVQMLGDRDRGWAWSRALLGIPAREIHLCGEQRALALVQNLLFATRERVRLECVEHRRLVPLAVSPPLDGSLRTAVENGDCFVCFSKRKVLDMRDRLNRIPGVECAAIYGAMPFQVREAEAARFNSGVTAHVQQQQQLHQYQQQQRDDASPTSSPQPAAKHVLVSTDAIAYGLNMNIERMIFTTLRKFDGTAMIDLPAATVQQIAGRSGRYGLSRQHAVGRCTVLNACDMASFQAAMATTLPPLTMAGLLPTSDILQLFVELETARARKRGETDAGTFFDIVSRFAAGCAASDLFFPCAMERSLLRIAELLEPVDALTLADRILFCYLPLSDGSAESQRLIVEYAADHAKGGPVALRIDVVCNALLADWERGGRTSGHGCSRASSPAPQTSREVIETLERLFRQAEMYCWLSWRFSKTFQDREKGLALKERITAALTKLNAT